MGRPIGVISPEHRRAAVQIYPLVRHRIAGCGGLRAAHVIRRCPLAGDSDFRRRGSDVVRLLARCLGVWPRGARLRKQMRQIAGCRAGRAGNKAARSAVSAPALSLCRTRTIPTVSLQHILRIPATSFAAASATVDLRCAAAPALAPGLRGAVAAEHTLSSARPSLDLPAVRQRDSVPVVGCRGRSQRPSGIVQREIGLAGAMALRSPAPSSAFFP